MPSRKKDISSISVSCDVVYHSFIQIMEEKGCQVLEVSGDSERQSGSRSHIKVYLLLSHEDPKESSVRQTNK